MLYLFIIAFSSIKLKFNKLFAQLIHVDFFIMRSEVGWKFI